MKQTKSLSFVIDEGRGLRGYFRLTCSVVVVFFIVSLLSPSFVIDEGRGLRGYFRLTCSVAVVFSLLHCYLPTLLQMSGGGEGVDGLLPFNVHRCCCFFIAS